MAFTLIRTWYPALTNPGAESGDATGWSIHTSGLLTAVTTNERSGSYCFYYSSAAWRKQYERFDLWTMFTADELAKGTLRVAVQEYFYLDQSASQAFLGLRFADSAGTPISGADTGDTYTTDDYTTDSYHLAEYSATAPNAARYVDIVVGSYDDAFIDDISFQYVRLYDEAGSSATFSFPVVDAEGSSIDAFGDGDCTFPTLTVEARERSYANIEDGRTIPVFTISATTANNAIGSCSIEPLEATGQTGIFSNGSCELEALSMEAYTGALGDITFEALTSSGQAHVDNVCSASVELPALSSSVYTGSRGAVIIPFPSSVASASVEVKASGTCVLPALTGSVEGDFEITCEGSPSLPALSATGQASKDISCSGAVVIPFVRSSASSAGMSVASGDCDIPCLTATGELGRVTAASGDCTMPILVVGGDYYPDGEASVSGRFDDYILRYTEPT